jgi:hypothetical protein
MKFFFTYFKNLENFKNTKFIDDFQWEILKSISESFEKRPTLSMKNAIFFRNDQIVSGNCPLVKNTKIF